MTLLLPLRARSSLPGCGASASQLRTPSLLCAVMLASLFLSACAVDEPVEGESAAEPDPAEPQDQDGGTLRVAYAEDTYPPERIGKWPLNTRIYDTLVNMDEELQLEPMLATSWEHDLDTNTYTFELRDDVVFHDGEAFTAEDVAYTLRQAAEANPRNSQQLGPDSVEVIDDHTVEVTPASRNNRLVEQLAHPSFGINQADSDPESPMGTGPFQFVEYRPSEQIVVERFDDYWDSERVANVERIEFNFVDDFQTRVLGLRGGDVDVIAEVAADAVGEVEGQPGIEVVRSGPAAFGRVDMNIAGIDPHDALADRTVRLAVSHAVDRDELITTVYGDNADPEPLPRHLFGEYADNVSGIEHDRAEAERLLDEAGWVTGDDGVRTRDGERLTLSYLPLAPAPDANLIGEVLQEQLARVGIEVALDPAGDPAITSERREAGRYDLLHQSGSQNDANPCFLLDILYYSPERGGREGNAFLAPGGAVDDAIEACRAAEDLDGAQESAAEAARLLIEEEIIYIPTGNAYRIWAVTDSVEGFVAHPGLGRANFEELSLAQ